MGDRSQGNSTLYSEKRVESLGESCSLFWGGFFFFQKSLPLHLTAKRALAEPELVGCYDDRRRTLCYYWFEKDSEDMWQFSCGIQCHALDSLVIVWKKRKDDKVSITGRPDRTTTSLRGGTRENIQRGSSVRRDDNRCRLEYLSESRLNCNFFSSYI